MPRAAFGLPQRRRRVIIVASLYLNVRDVLLAQGVCQCMGVCRLLFSPAEPCYRCFQTNCDAATVAVQVGRLHTQRAQLDWYLSRARLSASHLDWNRYASNPSRHCPCNHPMLPSCPVILDSVQTPQPCLLPGGCGRGRCRGSRRRR